MTDNTSNRGDFTFMQLADPQFGLFARFSGQTAEAIAGFQARGLNIKPAPQIKGFSDETRLFEAAINIANILRPAFVVVCGDIVNQWNDTAQAEEALRIGELLDDGIDLHWVAGNHDVGADDRPTRAWHDIAPISDRITTHFSTKRPVSSCSTQQSCNIRKKHRRNSKR